MKNWKPRKGDISRRSLLSLSGGALGALGLSACAGVGGKEITARQFCTEARGKDRQLDAIDAELSARFRELDCLSLALVTRGAEDGLNQEVKARFWQLHALLSGQPYRRPIAEAWRRFYGLTSRLHEHRNARARNTRLPVYAYNGHQHAARLWLDETARRGPRGPLLHFDSHDDMRGLRRSDAILAAVATLGGKAEERSRALQSLRELIPDHATPVSAGVLGRAFDHVVWAAPRWSAILEFHKRPLLYADYDRRPTGRNFGLLHDSRTDPAGALPHGHARPWDDMQLLTSSQLRTLAHQRPIHLSFVQTHRPRLETLQSLTTNLAERGFILDIDLDYFLTVDIASGFDRRRLATDDRLARAQVYEEQLHRARQLVDTRLEEFGILLADLRRARRIPSMITLADSTYRPFSPFAAGKGYWEYMPYEFAAYVHWRVRRLLAEVYAGDGVAAGV